MSCKPNKITFFGSLSDQGTSRAGDRKVWLSYEVTRNRVEKATVPACGFRTTRFPEDGLESAREQIRNSRQQGFVFLVEGVFLVAVDVYLTKNIGFAPNQHDDL